MMNQLLQLLPEHKKIGSRYFKTNSDAEYSGVYLGEKIDNKFIPSLMFLESLKGKLKIIKISKKAAWNFSKGKNIPKDAILEEDGTSEVNLLLVSNKEGDILGLADENYKNIFDLGHYLRREYDR